MASSNPAKETDTVFVCDSSVENAGIFCEHDQQKWDTVARRLTTNYTVAVARLYSLQTKQDKGKQTAHWKSRMDRLEACR